MVFYNSTFLFTTENNELLPFSSVFSVAALSSSLPFLRYFFFPSLFNILVQILWSVYVSIYLSVCYFGVSVQYSNAYVFSVLWLYAFLCIFSTFPCQYFMVSSSTWVSPHYVECRSVVLWGMTVIIFRWMELYPEKWTVHRISTWCDVYRPFLRGVPKLLQLLPIN